MSAFGANSSTACVESNARGKGQSDMSPAKAAGNRQKSLWQLTKEQDSFARSETAKDILEDAPNSVLTGRTLKEIDENWNQGKNKNELQGELFDQTISYCCVGFWQSVKINPIHAREE